MAAFETPAGIETGRRPQEDSAAAASVTSHACPGCGLALEPAEGPVHPYIGASPECWALYGRVLARAYGDPACREVLALVVDSYACQHPGVAGRRSAQSVDIHLMTLCMVLEGGTVPGEVAKHHARLAAGAALRWLEPPRERGRITVAALFDAPTTEAYVETAWEWATEIWGAWRAHHDTVRRWIASAGR